MTQAGMTRVEITESSAASPADGRRVPARSDAQHNHQRILVVAREALAISADASLNSIAKKAGVGPGTLYRHFPNREVLILAVYEEDVQALAGSAAELLAQHRPLEALRLWFDRLAGYGTTKHSLANALHSATSDGRADATSALVIDALDQLLSACQRDGSIRSDIEPGDVLLLLGVLWRVERGADAPARVARLLDLILAGMQAEAPQRTSRPGRARRSLGLLRRLLVVSFGAPRSL
jgi:AcrR family transcriptional regulator